MDYLWALIETYEHQSLTTIFHSFILRNHLIPVNIPVDPEPIQVGGGNTPWMGCQSPQDTMQTLIHTVIHS